MRDDSWLHFQNSLKMHDDFFKKAITLQIFQVTEVLTQKRFAPTHHANRVFQLAAHGKYRLRLTPERNRRRNIAARPAQHLRLAGGNAHHRISAPSEEAAGRVPERHS